MFFLHAPHFGFFLNINAFRHSSLLAFNLGHPSRPTPGLLSVVHLLGLHFSQPEAFQGQESAVLTRAVQHVSTDLMGTHPNKVIHTLQAEVLLAYYFLRTGSLLEAKCRTGTAISLALGSGLHKIRSANLLVPSTISIGSHDHAYLLPHPADTLQEAERINGFWAVLVLHKFITVALEVAAHVCGALEAPGMQIDTPWPIDIDQFEEVRVSCLLLLKIDLTRFDCFSGYHTARIAREFYCQSFFERLSCRQSQRRLLLCLGRQSCNSLSSGSASNWPMVT